MPYLVRAICGGTIGLLVGLYVVNTYYGGQINFVVLLGTLIGALAGIYFFRR